MCISWLRNQPEFLLILLPQLYLHNIKTITRKRNVKCLHAKPEMHIYVCREGNDPLFLIQNSHCISHLAAKFGIERYLQSYNIIFGGQFAHHLREYGKENEKTSGTTTFFIAGCLMTEMTKDVFIKGIKETLLWLMLIQIKKIIK